MYNRYIPQSDGSYRRNRCPDQIPPPRPQPPKPIPKPDPPCPEPEPHPVCPPPREESRSCPRPRPQSSGSISDFLRQLLPKGFDTSDLLIVLLLLLMAGDCQEDQNTAMLTLVLYLFL